MQKKRNIIVRMVIALQRWMDSVPGQTFLNYAYSWGASIVILGALFKLTHLPGGNIMLFIGMGTEVIVFFISAFDRPFDKEQIGKEIPKTYVSEAEAEATALAAAHGMQPAFVDGGEAFSDGGGMPAEGTGGVIIGGGSGVVASGSGGGGGVIVNGGGGGGVIVVGGGASGQTEAAEGGEVSAEGTAAAAVAGPAVVAAQQPATQQPSALTVPQDADAQQLAAIIRAANDELLQRAQAVLSPEMEEATKVYIEKLRALAETFEKVDEQSGRLTKDSEEMENLNRTLTGINKVYELHLKSISLQVGTIDEINNQTHKLSEQIQHLNQVYGRMIEALTVNMGHAPATPQAPNN